MYKKALCGLMLINVLLLVNGWMFWRPDSKVETKPVYEVKLNEIYVADQKENVMGIASIAASGQRILDYQVLDKELKYDLSVQDLEVLCRIVEAEAGGEDEAGKLLVANVVLNRVNHEKFPDTVTEVVFQQSEGVTQFSPVRNGRYWTVSVSEETKAAVMRALEGEDISEGALFFAARKYADSDAMQWFDEKLKFLFVHGGHEFFTTYE